MEESERHRERGKVRAKIDFGRNKATEKCRKDSLRNHSSLTKALYRYSKVNTTHSAPLRTNDIKSFSSVVA